MAKKQTPNRNGIPGHDDGQRLTPEEAAEMVRAQWAGGQLDDNESSGDFLLLIRSIAYADADEREAIVLAIENTLMPFDAALNGILRRRLSTISSWPTWQRRRRRSSNARTRMPPRTRLRGRLGRRSKRRRGPPPVASARLR